MVKVILICLIVLSNTLERTSKVQKHFPITEKLSQRKLQGEASVSGNDSSEEKCEEGGNYIIVKYSEDVSLPLPSEESTGGEEEGVMHDQTTGRRIQNLGSETEQSSGESSQGQGSQQSGQSSQGDESSQSGSYTESGIEYICAGENKIKLDTTASEFKFYFREDIYFKL